MSATERKDACDSGDQDTPRPAILDWKLRLDAVDLLNLAKREYTYRQLKRQTGLEEAVLSRYRTGAVLPQPKRARDLINRLNAVMRVEQRILRMISFDDQHHFDNTKLISDPFMLELASQRAAQLFGDQGIDVVLTPAVDGIPLSTILAHKLGASLCIAKKEREVGVPNFLEGEYEPLGSGLRIRLFVPRGAIRKGDKVLIVDDMIDSCRTHSALAQIVSSAGAQLVGVFALIANGEEWRTFKERYSCQVHALVQLNSLKKPKAGN